MNPSWLGSTSRRRAVRGPGIAVVAAVVAVAGASNSFADGPRHVRARAGRPNAYATPYKLDGELNRRASRGFAQRTTRVIVEWQPGAAMPDAYRAFARSGSLNILNGTVLDV